MDGYLDWIRDLSWLEKDGFILIIHNYTKFINNDLLLKKSIIDDFSDTILPWWQDEVENCVVSGRAKSFNVYLVD